MAQPPHASTPLRLHERSSGGLGVERQYDGGRSGQNPPPLFHPSSSLLIPLVLVLKDLLGEPVPGDLDPAIGESICAASNRN